MGLWEKVKDIMSIPEEDEIEEEAQEEKTAEPKSEPAARVVSGRSKTVQYNPQKPEVQVVLVKPDRFEDVPSIADHLNNKKTVVLNLENANRETSRRIIDFISGVAYANHGNMRKVANSTFIVVPQNVDVMGELMLDDFGGDGKLYF